MSAVPKKTNDSWLYVGLAVATVIAIGVFGYSVVKYKLDVNQSREYDRETEPNTAYTVCIKAPPLISFCPREDKNAENEKRRDDDDLDAQQEMADWAFVVALISGVGGITSIVGLFLLPSARLP